MRYVLVSVTTAPLGQILLAFFFIVCDFNALISNVLAVFISTVPNYLFNRIWVWNKTKDHNLQKEIIPYWTLAFLGLILSTCFVIVADRLWDSWVTINLANAAGYGILWVAKYFILDKYIFTRTESAKA